MKIWKLDRIKGWRPCLRCGRQVWTSRIRRLCRDCRRIRTRSWQQDSRRSPARMVATDDDQTWQEELAG